MSSVYVCGCVCTRACVCTCVCIHAHGDPHVHTRKPLWSPRVHCKPPWSQSTSFQLSLWLSMVSSPHCTACKTLPLWPSPRCSEAVNWPAPTDSVQYQEACRYSPQGARLRACALPLSVCTPLRVGTTLRGSYLNTGGVISSSGSPVYVLHSNNVALFEIRPTHTIPSVLGEKKPLKSPQTYLPPL